MLFSHEATMSSHRQDVRAPLRSGVVSLPGLTEEAENGIRARGEEALTELAQALAENPLVGGALARALGAGERAAVAQRQAIGALNLASSSDFERLEVRLRSFASRLEAIEDSIDQLRDDVARLKADSSGTQASDA